MISQPQRHGDDGQRRIDESSGREGGASGDIKVLGAVHPRVRVGDAAPGIVMHPRRTHMVGAAT